MINVKRRHQLIIVLETIFSSEPRCFSLQLFIKAIDGIFYGFYTGVINPLGMLGEHEKSL